MTLYTLGMQSCTNSCSTVLSLLSWRPFLSPLLASPLSVLRLSCLFMTAHVIYSAIQPTGRLHLGNYLGAVRQWLDLQSLPQSKLIFGLADLHALTSSLSSSKPPSSRIDNVAMMTELLACGLDPKKCILKRQSRVCLIWCHVVPCRVVTILFFYTRSHALSLSLSLSFVHD